MKIRIGKELHISWSILTQGENKPLEGRDLRLYIQDPNRRRRALEFTTDANTILVVIPANTLTRIGRYALILTENEGQEGQTAVDANPAFTLVETTREEDTNNTGAPNLEVATINLATGNLTLRMVLQELFSGKDGGDMKTGDILPVLRDGELHRVSAKIGAGDWSAQVEELTAKVEENAAKIEGAISDASKAITAAQNAQDAVTSASENAAQAQNLANDAKRIAEQSQGTATNALSEATDAKSIGNSLKLAIFELKRSIPLIKAFWVETGSKAGYCVVDGTKVDIPANTRRSISFNKNFVVGDIWTKNSGIKYFGMIFTDTSTIVNAGNMFANCSSLTSLDLTSFNTSAVTYMNYMFYNCTSLVSLDLSSFDTSAVTTMLKMFYFCTSLVSLDLTSFNTSAVTDMKYMFSACDSLASLLLGPNFFKTTKVTTIDFSMSFKWTDDTVVTSLVTNSYDRAAAGLNTLTLILTANTKAALTDEQKAAITNKGYTIA